jgi:purine-nucleoside/S-methyl-5'-thioadenosine phosphorylase / adenosine deaminase
VLERTVAEMQELGAHAHQIVAWLGPAIGPAAFEVGADVLESFRAAHRYADAHFASATPGKWYADLYGIARQQLEECGVGLVGGGGFCTKTDGTRFYSWRRERGGGRMAALVWLQSGTTDPHV